MRGWTHRATEGIPGARGGPSNRTAPPSRLFESAAIAAFAAAVAPQKQECGERSNRIPPPYPNFPTSRLHSPMSAIAVQAIVGLSGAVCNGSPHDTLELAAQPMVLP